MMKTLQVLTIIGLILIACVGPTEARSKRGFGGEFTLGLSPVGHWPERTPERSATMASVVWGFGLGWGMSETDVISLTATSMLIADNDSYHRRIYSVNWYHFWGTDYRWHSLAGAGYLRGPSYSRHNPKKGAGLVAGVGYQWFGSVHLEGSTFLGLVDADSVTEFNGQVSFVTRFLFY